MLNEKNKNAESYNKKPGHQHTHERYPGTKKQEA